MTRAATTLAAAAIRRPISATRELPKPSDGGRDRLHGCTTEWRPAGLEYWPTWCFFPRTGRFSLVHPRLVVLPRRSFSLTEIW